MVRSKLLFILTGVLIVASMIMTYLALLSFGKAEVLIKWSTASEVDTVGFVLYRSAELEGSYIRVNQNLIPASSDPLIGGSYSYTDNDVNAGRTYYYELEEVEVSGITSRFGPIEVKAEQGGIYELTLAVIFVFGGVFGLVMLRIRQKRIAHE